MTQLPSEENPYWHSEGQTHSIDLESIRGLCFEIFNIFAASAALAGEFEFADELDDPANSSLFNLHHELAESCALRQLLQLCMLVRTYDDTLSQSEHSERYAAHVKETTGEDYIGTLDNGRLSLRKACNKVIHAREVRPIYDRVDREVEGKAKAETFWHLSGEIELSGVMDKKAWNAVLYVQPFLDVVLDRVAFGWGG